VRNTATKQSGKNKEIIIQYRIAWSGFALLVMIVIKIPIPYFLHPNQKGQNHMKIVLQRVNSASVKVDGAVVGSIDKGYVIYLGVASGDDKAIVDKMVDKIARLRIFADASGKTNLTAGDVGGGVLVVSQFTLNADLSSNRPSFSQGANAELAKELYEYFIEKCINRFKQATAGQFGAHMHVYSDGDGPFTLVLEG